MGRQRRRAGRDPLLRPRRRDAGGAQPGAGLRIDRGEDVHDGHGVRRAERLAPAAHLADGRRCVGLDGLRPVGARTAQFPSLRPVLGRGAGGLPGPVSRLAGRRRPRRGGPGAARPGCHCRAARRDGRSLLVPRHLADAARSGPARLLDSPAGLGDLGLHLRPVHHPEPRRRAACGGAGSSSGW